MKKIFVALACALMIASGAFAQDARQRTAKTIVADALAQLPIAHKADFNTVMGELVGTGSQGVVQLADMLVPADKGQNNIVEYALDGLVAYASGNASEQQIAQIRAGLKEAIDKCTDNPNKAYLMTLLQRISRSDDAAFFVKYINDPYLSEWAQNGLIIAPDCDNVVLGLNGKVSNDVFARLVGAKKIAAAEPVLLSWLPSEGATASINGALANMGSVAALPVLAKAAQAEQYAWVPETNATASYTKLLTRLASDPASKKEVVKEAKALLNKTQKSNVRDAAAYAIFIAEGKNALPVLLKGMKDADRKYRVALLRYCEPWADADVYAALGKIVADKKKLPAKTDIVNWFGTNKIESQLDVIINAMNANCDELANAAIAAASKIGGQKALNALIAQLNGPRAAVANKALLSFNGNINDAVVAAISDKNPATQLQALSLASVRHIKAAAPAVFALLNSNDEAIASAANAALPGVVSPADFDKLCSMLEAAPATEQANIQNALKASVAALDANQRFATVKPYVAKSKNQVLYYPILAQAGTDDAVKMLAEGYSNPATKDAAFAALLQVNNPNVAETLCQIAASDKAAGSRALVRYAQLVANSPRNNVQKYEAYRNALAIASDATASAALINALASTGMYQALMIANSNISNPALANYCATAIRSIMNKNIDNYGGDDVKAALENAVNVFRADKGNADAGYAVDDIKGMLAKVAGNGYVKFNDFAYTAVVGAPDAKKTAKLVKALKEADKVAAQVWSAGNGAITYAGGTPSNISLNNANYENFEMWFDYTADSNYSVPFIGVRSMPINVEGAFPASAFNPVSQANTIYLKVVNDRLTVTVNGIPTVTNAFMSNTYDDSKPVYTTGNILLIGNGSQFTISDVYVKTLPSTPRSELTAEEKAEGFEMLFDGTSMHKWTGNTAGYIPQDGYIYVDSQWGGNLYTKKEYSDFVYRFEFCFDRPGVNNGVGIRTPMGVDAAFHGMEIQILDHDDPIYKDLNDYQVHGSVYGVIPAKRAKFEHGVWNTEEIRAVGDHITVTVNGEVILDGNIREACQGHAVGDEGEEGNHWMVDHRNHPGLFNKSGHIGFLGHGQGIRFRNVRVKDLSKSK